MVYFLYFHYADFFKSLYQFVGIGFIHDKSKSGIDWLIQSKVIVEMLPAALELLPSVV